MLNTIIVNPEVIAKVLANNEVDVFILWSISKKIDITGNGIIQLKEIINIAEKVFNFKSNFVYEKIKKGIGLYWTAPSGEYGDKKICLLGINKVVERLNPNVTRSKPVSIPISFLQSQSLKFIKELFICIFAARYEDERPVSIETICMYTGQSESTVRNAIKNCKYISVKENFELISKTTKKSRLNLTNDEKQDFKKLKLIPRNYSYSICKQIPNSYKLLELDRLPLKTRPKALKVIDKQLLTELVPRQYHQKGGKLYSDHNKTIL